MMVYSHFQDTQLLKHMSCASLMGAQMEVPACVVTSVYTLRENTFLAAGTDSDIRDLMLLNRFYQLLFTYNH